MTRYNTQKATWKKEERKKKLLNSNAFQNLIKTVDNRFGRKKIRDLFSNRADLDILSCMIKFFVA